MNGFANGGRTNNLDMPAFMKALTESHRDAIATPSRIISSALAAIDHGFDPGRCGCNGSSQVPHTYRARTISSNSRFRTTVAPQTRV
jgi:hypothetical protein